MENDQVHKKTPGTGPRDLFSYKEMERQINTFPKESVNLGVGRGFWLVRKNLVNIIEISQKSQFLSELDMMGTGSSTSWPELKSPVEAMAFHVGEPRAQCIEDQGAG
jgi:hypothetical protein